MLGIVDELAVRIGQRIKAARKHAKVSQSVLAELVDVSLRAVQQWESGERRCSLDHLRSIATSTNVRLGYLTGDAEQMSGAPATTDDVARLESKIDAILSLLRSTTYFKEDITDGNKLG